jgi:hypothetical protein
MTVTSELHHSLQSMGFAQLLLALLFLACYVLALSGFTGPTGRRRAALVALLAAVGFALFTPSWVHGVMLVAITIGGIGLFVALVSAVNVFLARGQESAPMVGGPTVEGAAQSTVDGPAPVHSGARREGAHAV